jgi:hypothetical protein
MAAYLTELGFAKYATAEYLHALAEDGVEEISDLPDLLEDEIYAELKPPMPKADAEKIVEDASKKELRDFLKWVDEGTKLDQTQHTATPEDTGTHPSVETGKTYSHLLPKLLEDETKTVDDVSELEADDAADLGITDEEVVFLSDKADEYISFVFSGKFLQTFSTPQTSTEVVATFPFAHGKLFEKYRDALVAQQVTSYSDIGELAESDVPAIKPDDLEMMQEDPRVLESEQKEEL